MSVQERLYVAGHYTTHTDRARTASRLTRTVWEANKHRAAVSRTAALRRVQRGWTIDEAITTPKANAGRTAMVLAFLATCPQATRDEIAAAVGRHRTALRDTLNLLIASGAVARSTGTTIKNRPVFFYRRTTTPDTPSELLEDDDEPVYRPYIHSIRRRIL